MPKKEYHIGNIKVKITSDTVYADICLENYENDSLSKLLGSLKQLEYAGFKTYDTSYETGYYDSVENISLTFYAPKNKINLEFLKEPIK